MVDTGIVQKLLDLLDRHVDEGNVTVQHAALSALRNLAIPGDFFFGVLYFSGLPQLTFLMGAECNKSIKYRTFVDNVKVTLAMCF